MDEQLKRILMDAVPIGDEGKVTLEAKLAEDLGMDDLEDRLDVLMECDEEFSINIDENDFCKVKTVADLQELIERLTGSGEGA